MHDDPNERWRPVRRFGRNLAGRDLIVGDVHGCYDMLWAALREVDFTTGKDRLFLVGDLIDRGPDCHRVLELIDWVEAQGGGIVRGNHEQAFIALHSRGEPDAGLDGYFSRAYRMGWVAERPMAWRMAAAAAFERLPIAMEIETARGQVGIVHADVPGSMSWPEFTAALETRNQDDLEALIMATVESRYRLQTADRAGVDGIGRVFVGHTPVAAPQRLSNVFHIDGGAVFGLLRDDPGRGRMFVADLMQSTNMFDVRGTERIATFVDAPEPEREFGRYMGV